MARLTSGSGSGSSDTFPTPRACDGSNPPMGRDKNKHGLEARVKYPTPTRADAERKGADYAKANRNNSGGDDLQTHVIKMLPTPTARDGKDTSACPSVMSRKDKLAGAVYNSLVPTPSASEHKAGTVDGKMQFMLTHSAKLSDPQGTAAGGQLNADWVELLMGYPMGWTSVEDGSAESTG